MSELLDTLRHAEVELHQSNTRGDAAKAGALLHDAFLEFGRSGRSYDRSTILDLMEAEQCSGQVIAQDFSVVELGTSAALLTYRSAVVDANGNGRRYTVRSSVWTLTPDGWKLRFHQGTPTSEFEIHTG